MRLIPSEPLSRLEDYIAAGGGEGLATALAMESGEVIAEVADSGLRGRGGAGFPTGTKWGSARQAAEETSSRPRLVVNGAEGEPGTYKVRLLLTMSPFAVLEGFIIAGYALGPDRIVIGVKAKTDQAARLREAIDELVADGWERADLVQVVEGPDECLFGAETGLLEVIEGNHPMPRWLPLFQQGLFASTEHAHPTDVNNAETLANVPRILAGGAAASGPSVRPDRPEPCCSRRRRRDEPGVYELPLGTPLRALLVDIAGASDIKAVFSGVSSPVIHPDRLHTPLTYEAMRTAGTSLGSGGFIVYDQNHCIVRVAICPTSQPSSRAPTVPPASSDAPRSPTCSALIEAGRATEHHLDAIADRLPRITDQTRCALPAGGQLLIGSLITDHRDEFVAHLGRTCDSRVIERVPEIDHLGDATGEVTSDPDYHRKRADWSFSPPRGDTSV